MRTKPQNKIIWEDLPKPVNAFTTRQAAMWNLNTGEAVQHYLANTKIMVVQKCITELGTFYRTASAEHHNLNWAFEAAALGLPNEIAPLVHLDRSNTSTKKKKASTSRKPAGKKQTAKPTAGSSRAEEGPRRKGFLARLFHKS